MLNLQHSCAEGDQKLISWTDACGDRLVVEEETLDFFFVVWTCLRKKLYFAPATLVVVVVLHSLGGKCF